MGVRLPSSLINSIPTRGDASPTLNLRGRVDALIAYAGLPQAERNPVGLLVRMPVGLALAWIEFVQNSYPRDELGALLATTGDLLATLRQRDGNDLADRGLEQIERVLLREEGARRGLLTNLLTSDGYGLPRYEQINRKPEIDLFSQPPSVSIFREPEPISFLNQLRTIENPIGVSFQSILSGLQYYFNGNRFTEQLRENIFEGLRAFTQINITNPIDEIIQINPARPVRVSAVDQLRARGWTFEDLSLSDTIGAPPARELPEVAALYTSVAEVWDAAQTREDVSIETGYRFFRDKGKVADMPFDRSSLEAYLRIQPQVASTAQDLLTESAACFTPLALGQGAPIDQGRVVWQHHRDFNDQVNFGVLSRLVTNIRNYFVRQASLTRDKVVLLDPESSRNNLVATLTEKLGVERVAADVVATAEWIIDGYCWWENACRLDLTFPVGEREMAEVRLFRDMSNPFARLYAVLLLGFGVTVDAQTKEFILNYF